LTVGTAGYWALKALFPDLDMGGVIGAIPPSLPAAPQFHAIAALVESPAILDIGSQLIATAVMLALIGSLQSLISISAADAVLGTRHGSDRELMLQGAGNVVSGLLGGMPTGGSPSVTRIVLESGGRGKAANVAHGLALLIMMAGLGQVIGLIPTSVMAGVVVASTFSQVDDWSRKLWRRVVRQKPSHWSGELVANLGLVAAVTIAVVTFGVLTALIVGMLLAFVIFVRHASHSVIRRTVAGTHLRSRTSRPTNARAALDDMADKMILVEVQGAVFFGSTDQLARHLEKVAAKCRVVIVDMKRVTDIDSSGVVALERLDKALSKAHCQLYLSHVADNGPLCQSLREMGFARIVDQKRVFEDRDWAIAAAEDVLLADAGVASEMDVEFRPDQFEIFRGVPVENMLQLVHRMNRIVVPPGTVVVREGDSGDSLFLLASGRVGVSRSVGGRTIRYGSYSAGISFGEMGLLTGRPRAADVVAETDVTAWHLDGEVFRELAKSNPHVSQTILTSICVNLSSLVSSLSDMVQELDE
jgi:MFS superfamily sulfate permease-like transporter